MTPEQIHHVRETWALAAATPETTSHLFYATLFRTDPSTKSLFVGDMALQGQKLTNTLNFIVESLDDLDTLVPAAEDLARRHVKYSVVKTQYASVGQALIETLRHLLGPAFTSDAEQAWGSVYGTLSDVMIEAAYPS